MSDTDKKIALILVVAFALMASLGLQGCRTQERQHDDFPYAIADQCYAAEARAIEWYQHKFGVPPKVPAVQVIREAKPLNGMACWTPNAHTVHVAIGYERGLEHEMRHVLCLYNGKGGSEEVVR